MKTIKKSLILTGLVVAMLLASASPAATRGNVCSAKWAAEAKSPTESLMRTRILSGWPNIQIFRPTTEIDPDGNTQPRDSLILRRQLLDWISLARRPLLI